MAEIFIRRSDELKVDLNHEGAFGFTAFHLACSNGRSEIVELFLENSSYSNIKFNKNLKGESGCFNSVYLNDTGSCNTLYHKTPLLFTMPV